MTTFIHWLQNIDRRWIYLVLAFCLVLSLILGKPETPIVTPPVQALYNAVDAAPASVEDGKIVIVGMEFSNSTLPENGNQARAVIRHLMLRHKRFALLDIGDPQGAKIGQDITNHLAEQYGYKYGTDWISFGYKPGTLAFFTSFPRDIPKLIQTDAVQAQPITSFPIMANVHTIRDVSLLVEMTASNSVTYWIADVQGKFPLKIGYGCTGVMAAEAYPWLDSGQLTGMMSGMKGAADYELLVDNLEQSLGHATYNPDGLPMTMKPARVLMFTQAVAHTVIILFIILGNIGFLLSRYAGRKAKGAQ